MITIDDTQTQANLSRRWHYPIKFIWGKFLEKSEHFKAKQILVKGDKMGLHISLYFPVDISWDETRNFDVYETSISHNFVSLAKGVGVYEIIWRPEETETISEARDLIAPLEKALAYIIQNPDKFTMLLPDMSTKDDLWFFYRFIDEYLKACGEYPKAKIFASR